MSNPLFNIQYGLFVISTCDAGKDNGCISNTVAQVTAQPNRISVALNKGNFTTELIQRSGKFTASILSEAADFELFKHFGFQSGRTVDKFDGFKDCRRVANGTLAITRGTNAFISADVEQAIDLDNLVKAIVELNKVIESDDSLGSGFCIGHSYLCNLGYHYDLESIVEYDIIPMLREYWFDNDSKFNLQADKLRNALK